MSEHFEAVEADLLAHYGVDLRAGVGARRLRALVQGLPPRGALHRAVDPEGWRWSSTDELLASLVEVTDLGNRLFYSAHAKKGATPMQPVKVRRPYELGRQLARTRTVSGPRRQSSADELRRFAGDAVEVTD